MHHAMDTRSFFGPAFMEKKRSGTKASVVIEHDWWSNVNIIIITATIAPCMVAMRVQW